MKKYNIGLDFGTYQTKACILDIENDVHEFFYFPDTQSFFLPSRVALKIDDTFEYGVSNGSTLKNEFHYFKIASAEDEEFLVETFDRTTSSYDIKDFEPFTPEFLSVIYLTYVLFSIKERFTKRNNFQKKSGGLLNRLFTTNQKHEETKYSIQIGIPTEWSQIKNLRRKRKFENILMVAEFLQQKFGTLESFLRAKSSDLRKSVHEIYSSNTLSNVAQLNDRLNDLCISVFPETAAGLTFIVKTRQLQPGYYAIMDIGGGSTDISFFCVESGNIIKYLASESYIVASNNVYREVAKENSLKTIQEVERKVQAELQSTAWEANDQLTQALVSVNKTLVKLIYKLFNRRVFYFKSGVQNTYNDQPIILYGGGSKLPAIDSGRVLIHDNGNRTSINIPLTFLEKQPIDRYTSIVNVLPADDTWRKDIALLVVALGLSYVKPDSFANWFGEDEYHAKDGPKWHANHVIAHPYNEDYFIYNVLASRWSKN
jgi:hypothetical protein